MSIVENLAGKIAFTLELRLIGLQPADVEHEAAELKDVAVSITHREGIDQDVNRAPILSLQHFFAIAQSAFALHERKKLGMAFGGGKNIFTGIAVQEFVATFVTEHANQGVINFDESTLGTAEEEPFLNVVEEFAIAALGLAPVGNVLQNVNSLKAFAAGGVYFRG